MPRALVKASTQSRRASSSRPAALDAFFALSSTTGDYVLVGRRRCSSATRSSCVAGDVRESFPAFLYVYVDDADRLSARDCRGAVSLEEPLDTPYGDRRAMVRVRTATSGRCSSRTLTARACNDYHT